MNAPRLAVPALAAIAFATLAGAQQVPPPPPLPPEGVTPPPPTAAVAGDPDLEPQVTIIRRDNEVVEEVRIGGELKFIRVTPRIGLPYYLVPDPAGRQFLRRESLDTTVKVPMWVLFSW